MFLYDYTCTLVNSVFVCYYCMTSLFGWYQKLEHILLECQEIIYMTLYTYTHPSFCTSLIHLIINWQPDYDMQNTVCMSHYVFRYTQTPQGQWSLNGAVK